MQDLSHNELNQAIRMYDQSQDELERVAKMKRIKNRKRMSKEELIITLLKSKRDLPELFNNTLDDSKISDIRGILNRLSDILPRRIRKEIKKKIYEIENRENLSEQEKEEINEYLTNLIRYLNKKEENRYHDRDDPDYYGIRDIERLLGDVDVGDSYKPILVKTAFKEDEEDESGYRIGYKLYESRGDKDKISSAEQYLVKIKPYLRDLINEHKKLESGEWKIQLNMHASFISSKGTGKTLNIYILSDNEKIMWVYETEDIINNLFISLKNNYQSEEQIMRGGNEFKFESVDRLDHKLHKIKLRRGGSCIESPEWIRNKRATINRKNENDNCFLYSLTAALNHQNIRNHPEKISNVKHFISEYNWEGIDFPSHQDGQEESEKPKNIMLMDYKNCEQNNETITLNISYVPYNKKEICIAYE